MLWFKQRRSSFGGTSTILGIGATLIGVSASVFAIDIPYYFNAQNQLQTALDAAALAGAAQLPNGTTQAQQAAIKLAQQNIVAGKALQSSDLTFASTKSKFTVTGKTQIPTLIGKFLCTFSGNVGRDPNQTTSSSQTGTHQSGGCDTMSVSAAASAAPAARDTVLVIDASSSMTSLGNGRPLSDVQKAAINYIKTIAALQNDSVDRIGLVKFNETATLLNPLTSQQESSQYSSVQNKVSSITLYSGSSWNTNYQAGLKAALDELASRGRPNAEQRVIFMTDGMPNQPAPSSYYQYSSAYPYNKCIDIVNNSAGVKALCTKKNGQTICPVLPSAKITSNLIPQSATTCTKTYVDNLQAVTNTQTDRAKGMGVTIDTIVINDPNDSDNASAVLRIMLKDPNWDPTDIAHYMNETTSGQAYTALAYDATTINSIYAKIAQDIHIRLTQ